MAFAKPGEVWSEAPYPNSSPPLCGGKEGFPPLTSVGFSGETQEGGSESLCPETEQER